MSRVDVTTILIMRSSYQSEDFHDDVNGEQFDMKNFIRRGGGIDRNRVAGNVEV